MKTKKFTKGILFSSLGSFWWGFLGTYYFKYMAFIGTIELVIHRSFWTCIILLFTTMIFKKWKSLLLIFQNKKKIFILFLTSILIFSNWTIWIYAVENNQIIDASFGYFIFPIVSVLLGYIFLNEKMNKKRFLSVLLVFISSTYLLLNLSSFPLVGFGVAIIWSTYNLLRKKVNVETDVGLLIESLFILPFILIFFYFLIQYGESDFSTSNSILMFLIILAGPMTVIPLFLYVKGVELSGLGPTGMTFFIAPTGQFLLGFFYFNEPFSFPKFLSFILIWIAVSIYLADLYEKN